MSGHPDPTALADAMSALDQAQRVEEEKRRAVDDLRKKLGEAERKIHVIGETLRIGGYIDNDGNPVTYPAFTGDAVAAALKLLHVRPSAWAPSLDALYRSAKESLASAHDRLANTEREMSSTITALRARIADLEDDLKKQRASRATSIGTCAVDDCHRAAAAAFFGRGASTANHPDRLCAEHLLDAYMSHRDDAMRLRAAMPSERVLLMWASAVPHHPLFSRTMRDEALEAITRLARASRQPCETCDRGCCEDAESCPDCGGSGSLADAHTRVEGCEPSVRSIAGGFDFDAAVRSCLAGVSADDLDEVADFLDPNRNGEPDEEPHRGFEVPRLLRVLADHFRAETSDA